MKKSPSAGSRGQHAERATYLSFLPLAAITEAALAAVYMLSGFADGISMISPFYRSLIRVLYFQIAALLSAEILPQILTSRPKIWERIRLALIAAGILIMVVAPTLTLILARSRAAPHMFAHDGLIQSEAAVSFLLEGENPCAVDYVQTPMVQWPYDAGGRRNPALHHYP
jgi:hypothetical protein